MESGPVPTRIVFGRVFEIKANVDGYLPGELQDWPANIQDVIYQAMEHALKKYKVHSWKVMQSRCGRDVDEEPYYIHIVLMEESRLVAQ